MIDELKNLNMNDKEKPGGGEQRIMFAHMKNLQICRIPPPSITPDKLLLEDVAAYNILMDGRDRKTSLLLREVPA